MSSNFLEMNFDYLDLIRNYGNNTENNNTNRRINNKESNYKKGIYETFDQKRKRLQTKRIRHNPKQVRIQKLIN